MISELEVVAMAANPATADTRLYMTDTMALWMHARCAVHNLHMQHGYVQGEPRGWALNPSKPGADNSDYNRTCFECRQP